MMEAGVKHRLVMDHVEHQIHVQHHEDVLQQVMDQVVQHTIHVALRVEPHIVMMELGVQRQKQSLLQIQDVVAVQLHVVDQ